MSGIYGLGRGFYAYTSDNTKQYQVAITIDDALAGGFSATTYGTLPAMPRGWKMRKVYGVSSGGFRTSTPVATPTTTLYTSGGTFVKGAASTSFTSQGIVGEKRSAKS
jgi:hypothetical protein